MPAGEGSGGAPAEAMEEAGREEVALRGVSQHRAAQEPAVPERKKGRCRLADRPAVAWLLENACIMSMAWCRCLLPTSPEGLSAWQYFLAVPAGGIVLIDGMIFLQMVLVHRVYAHIPFLSEGSESAGQVTLRAALWEWLVCNFPTYLLGGVLGLAAESRAGGRRATPQRSLAVPAAGRRLLGRPLLRRLFSFLAKLAVARLAADLAFYGAHRALHTRLLYSWIHKRHHEHRAPALVTNFHFTILDLFLEGTFPLVFAISVVRRFWSATSGNEKILLAAYIQWYEIGSHAGKAVPVVSYLPPIAPLYRWLFGDLDANNVQFHSDHHALSNCNYGITQWLDHILGTARCKEKPRVLPTEKTAGNASPARQEIADEQRGLESGEGGSGGGQREV